MNRPPGGPEGSPELIARPGTGGPGPGGGFEHLSTNRSLIVRRALLASAVGGVIPIPVMDEYVAGRVKAGLLMKLAERRQVDLLQSSAELLGDPREGTAMRNATLTAATLLALKMAWRKFFALLAIGRRAEEMATTFQLGTLFDHFCAKMHVGSGIDRNRAAQLRAVILASLAETERTALVAAFRDGSRVLGRTMLEAPAWASEHLERASRRWAESGGTTTEGPDEPDAAPGMSGGPPGVHDVPESQAGPSAAEGAGSPKAGEGTAEDARWVDRAAHVVESRLGMLGHGYLAALIRTFERRWQEAEAARVKAEQAAAAEAAPRAAEPPHSST